MVITYFDHVTSNDLRSICKIYWDIISSQFQFNTIGSRPRWRFVGSCISYLFGWSKTQTGWL